MENLSLKMNYFKKKLKLTNEQISALSGIPVQTVATISSGRTKNPSLRTLKSLAKFFNCTLDDLINLTDAKTPVLLDEQTVKLIEKLKNSDSIKRLFELVSVMDNTDVQAVVGLAERLYVTSGDKNNVK